jgi:glycosyltransferase involved in cell wall biosynthesis
MPKEIVVVDNCSTDDTRRIVSDLMRESTIIKLYVNNINVGMVENFNLAMSYCTGDYVKFLCADDLLLPSCLMKMVAALAVAKDCHIICSSRLIVDVNLQSPKKTNFRSVNCRLQGHSVINELFWGGNYIGEPTSVLIKRVDGMRFDKRFPQLMDYELWIRLLENSDLYYIAEPTCLIRRHSNQGTVLNRNSRNIVADNINIYAIYSQKSYIVSSRIRRIKRRALMANRVFRSRRYFSTDEIRSIMKNHGSLFVYNALVFFDWFKFEFLTTDRN